tara:strand:+ start:1493 stop:2731 length:1239 start_codon:yes stop_codon:yes gene_type:complete
MKKGKIFISIASYRDPELIPTIDDCIKKASHPSKLCFCVLNQYCDDDSFNNFKKYRKDKRFKFIDLNYKQSRGVCFARSIISSHFSEEEYYLQLDSHHRFVKGWDEICKSKLRSLKKQGIKKPLLSSYLPSYDPDGDRLKASWRLVCDRFMPEGPIFLKPHSIDNPSGLELARFLGGHFIFTSGKFCQQVPYDPFLYFHGEETSLSARAYTHGYDIFHLDEVVAWHFYGRKNNIRHWDDDSKWGDLNLFSFRRYRSLLLMDDKKDRGLGPYGLGSCRSLSDYENFCGIKFSSRQISQDAKDGVPPCRSSNLSAQNLLSEFKYCLDVPLSVLPENDYDFFAIAFHDKDDKEICRLDAAKAEVRSILTSADSSASHLTIWRQFEYSSVPDSWVFWPRSAASGYGDRIQHKIPQG